MTASPRSLECRPRTHTGYGSRRWCGGPSQPGTRVRPHGLPRSRCLCGLGLAHLPAALWEDPTGGFVPGACCQVLAQKGLSEWDLEEIGV